MKIDVTPIVRAHVSTMRDHSDNRYSLADFALFYGLPVVAAVIASRLGWKFNADVLNSLLTSFSIFAGLLLTLLLLIFTFSARDEQPTMVSRLRVSLVKELHDNVAYSILIAIVLVGVTMIAITILKMNEGAEAFTGPWLTGIVSFLTLHFMLILLMILKRLHIIMNREIERPSIRKSA